jgi:hypothetical protein
MAKRKSDVAGAESLQGAGLLRNVFPMLARLAAAGTERDRAGNRQLLFSQYAALVLVGLFNPVLNSARGLVAASGLKKVRKLTGGKKTSIGAFSESVRVFDPRLLEGVMTELRSKVHRQRGLNKLLSNRQAGDLPDRLIERLVAVDGSVLTALPQLVGRFSDRREGQWRLHAHVHVDSETVAALRLTEEPAQKGQAERDVLTEIIESEQIDVPDSRQSHLFLMDRGYRSAALFNRIVARNHDYVCRLNRKDGRVLQESEIDLPSLSDVAQEMGIVADELITLGGHCGASKVGSDHPLRRITLIPPDDRASSARQGRRRTDQGGRDELILATSILDLPAEQIVQLYEHRWQIELFFRFLKHVLKCETLISSKTAGVKIQVYCAIIAALLLALATGGNLTKRHFEMICLYFSGWADEHELLDSLESPKKRPP